MLGLVLLLLLLLLDFFVRKVLLQCRAVRESQEDKNRFLFLLLVCSLSIGLVSSLFHYRVMFLQDLLHGLFLGKVLLLWSRSLLLCEFLFLLLSLVEEVEDFVLAEPRVLLFYRLLHLLALRQILFFRRVLWCWKNSFIETSVKKDKVL